MELPTQYIGIKSRLDGHTAGSAHLMNISRTNGLTFKGTLTRCMDGILERLWIVKRVKPGKTKLANSSRAGNYPNASKPRDENAPYWSRVDLNGLHDTQENLSTNSLTAYHTSSSEPFNPQNFVLIQMLQHLALVKEG